MTSQEDVQRVYPSACSGRYAPPGASACVGIWSGAGAGSTLLGTGRTARDAWADAAGKLRGGWLKSKRPKRAAPSKENPDAIEVH